jgi:2',3'-cyclic-nucleotide 2'-phosphodiesterase (5'-nucleotidase family)
VIWINNGGIFYGGSPPSDLRFAAVQEGYRMIGVRAGLLTEREIYQGLVAFRSWIDTVEYPLISTNIRRRQRPPEPSVPLVHPYHIEAIDLPSGGTFRIGLLGLSPVPKWPKYSMHAGQFDIRDPAEAAAFAVEELEGKADYVVALVDMGHQAARRLAEQVGGIDLILGRGEGKHRIGDTQLLLCKPQGVEVGEVRLNIDRKETGRWEVKTEIHRIRLSDRYPSDPEGQDLVDRVLDEIESMEGSTESDSSTD